jgi:tetratricopeptide (TPR) repeat protein
VIEPGDTLLWIADCRGVSLETLARANSILHADLIRAGDALRVPSKNLCTAYSRAGVTFESPAASRAAKTAAPPPETAPLAPRASADPTRGPALLDAARAAYDAADFENALRLAEAASRALANAPPSEANPLRARAHALSGMAAAGLERPEQAVAEFGRALALDPTAELAPDDRSPRLVELYDAARALGTRPASAPSGASPASP